MTPTLSAHSGALFADDPPYRRRKSMFSAALGGLLDVALTLLDSMSGTIGL
ncbi:hypothetical protein [Nocardia ignorata]|uniref:hypothetical protein n=1 Tax=Nocardia ignorata TaxID=145285 RepID=UPI000A9E6441|nr:hypothetical protein [Nocardia ignorata]